MAEHENRVATYCTRFLQRISPSLAGWGESLGRWHDLGKYQPAFQERIRGEKRLVEHAVVGAAVAFEQLPKIGQLLAFCIAGHHAGLANYRQNDSIDFSSVSRRPLREAVEEGQRLLESLRPTLPQHLLEPPDLQVPAWLRDVGGEEQKRSCEFFIRILFSALVDADRLATAEFYQSVGQRHVVATRDAYDPLDKLSSRLDRYIDNLCIGLRDPASPVNRLRSKVLDACRDAAAQPPGLFSLTVPTGGGKTLSAMSFALRHATEHGLDRVIVIIPYTSIIEQNAKVYRDALAGPAGDNRFNVLEHHSGIDEQKAETIDSRAELQRRLAAENWDAPIVVSTAVQFFESLFSDHPSRCRKLHRIARSVVILDEVQTLPPGLLAPILDALGELTAHYGTTVVLSTATPPALRRRDAFQIGFAPDRIRSIIPDPVALAGEPAARRVSVEWRVGEVTPYNVLAPELAARERVLAVVHRRADARALAEQLPDEGRFHLSALMCPAHRLEVIGAIHRALAENRCCRVVATQLVEAGVDLDFPVVYRALTGLDSLAQAAGRCDREGRLTQAAQHPAGRLIVFRAESTPPAPILRKAAETVETLLGLQDDEPALQGGLDPFNPDHCELFFRLLYEKAESDSRRVQRERADWNFANSAVAFRMIDDWSQAVVIPWGEGAERVEAHRADPSRDTLRALQPYTVAATPTHVDALHRAGAVERWADTTLYLPTRLFGNRYSEQLGLELQVDPTIDAEMTVC